jgi:RHS repeat-associated protein
LPSERNLGNNLNTTQAVVVPGDGLYYCQSRYYDAVVGRWINADGLVTTGQGVLSFNMYSYCNNNWVNLSDPDGLTPEEANAWAGTIEAWMLNFLGCYNPYYRLQYIMTYSSLYNKPAPPPPAPAPAPVNPSKTIVTAKENTGSGGRFNATITVTKPKGLLC